MMKLEIVSTINGNHDIPSSAKCEWSKINWQKAKRKVRELQGRIFEASKRNDSGQIRNLQKLLMRSYYLKLLAVRRVSQENVDRRTPGVDKLVRSSPKERGEMVDLLCQRDISKHEPSPVNRIYIPRGKGRPPRPLGIPTILDRCVQYIVTTALEAEWEQRFEGCSYGFRPGRSAHDAMQRIFNVVANCRTEKRWVLDGDITGCFDNISHGCLISELDGFPQQALVERWLKCGYLEKGASYRTTRGTPQGGIITPLLANIALHGMEKALSISTRQGNQSGPRSFVRYAYEFVVFTKSEADAEKARDLLKEWLNARGLEISKLKNRIVHIDEGFNFLGFHVRRYPLGNYEKKPGHREILIKPSKESIQKATAKLKDIWVRGQGNPFPGTIRKLNLFIAGWSNYFRRFVASDAFHRLDNQNFVYMVRYARKTHPKKSWKWRKAKYFGAFARGSQAKWTYGDKISGAYVTKFSALGIVNHTMVKGLNSPLDPALASYWEERNRKCNGKDFLSKRCRIVAGKQKQLCPVCQDSLHNGEALQLHHKVPPSKGRTNKIENLEYLHVFCHQQRHRNRKGLIDFQADPLDLVFS